MPAPTPVRQRELEQLRNLLKASRISDQLAKYIEGLGVESTSDFVGLVESGRFEQQLNDLVLEKSPEKGSLLQLSRLRSAWSEAHTSLEQLRKRKIEGIAEDAEEPLEPSVAESLLSQWHKIYGHRLEIHLTPSDSLLGRVFREFQKGTASLIPVRKISSLYKASLPQQKTEVSLHLSLKLQLDAEPSPVKDLVDYYFRLRILANAYSMAGSHKVDSVLHPGSQVTFAPLEVNLNYADQALRKAFAVPASAAVQLGWLESRDLRTRGKMVEMLRLAMPQGEALTKALAESELLWNSASQLPHLPSVEPPPVAELNPPAKSARRERTVNEYKGRAICKKRNDNRKCAEPCPDNRLHVCDIRLSNGQACGSKDHVRSQCPHAQA